MYQYLVSATHYHPSLSLLPSFWGATTLFLFTLLGAGCGEESSALPGLSEHSFLHGEESRSYLLYRPQVLPESAPLVLVLHGYTSEARTIMEYSNFNAIADRHGFIVAYPQGTRDQRGNTFWNVGYEFHDSSTVDDLDFLLQLSAFLVEEHKLSESHTFITGMSNGGDMCYLLACRHSDKFRAAAPIAGTMMADYFTDCAPASPMPLMAVVGTADSTTRFTGDMANVDEWGAYQSIPYIIDFWVNYSGYKGVQTDTLPNRDPTDGSIVINTQYFNDQQQAYFQYLRVEGGGHDWPGAWGNMDFSTSEYVWDFFSRHLE